MVSNKDIGFLHEGQQAVVKIETFDFTKYGFVEGAVGKVSHGAIADKEHRLVYAAHVTLGQTVIEIDGNRVPLALGMAVGDRALVGSVTAL